MSPELRNHFAAVLNSRQGRYPRGADIWVQNTIAAVKNAVESGFTILSSVGMNTHGLVLWATSHFGGRQLVIYPLAPGEDEDSAIERTTDDFKLNLHRTRFRFITSRGRNVKNGWRTRDSLLISMAQRIYLISMRKRSSLTELLGENPDAQLVHEFETGYARRKIWKYALDFDEIERKYPSKHWRYLTHWTHSHPGPWHYESKAHYFKALVASVAENPRSAQAMLEEIRERKKIIASSAMVRGAKPVVSFTEHPPSRALKLMRWRTGLGRYNFEPYGVAVDRSAAEAVGTRPVIYGDETTYRSLPQEDKILFQSTGKKFQWHHEGEWRYVGDFDLSSLPKNSYFFVQLSQVTGNGK